MTKREYADQYAKGMMSRRQFIKALVAVGVTLVSATAFADVLAPVSQSLSGLGISGVGNDLYGDLYDFYPPGHGGTPPGRGGNPPGQATPPGQGGTPPGRSGETPPGHGGTPPGQNRPPK